LKPEIDPLDEFSHGVAKCLPVCRSQNGFQTRCPLLGRQDRGFDVLVPPSGLSLLRNDAGFQLRSVAPQATKVLDGKVVEVVWGAIELPA
jgi:hypothetical protein